MPFTKYEAAEWAEMVCEIKDEFEGRPVTYSNLCSVLDTVLECISRDAEAGGWYGEWVELSLEAYRPRKAEQNLAEQLHERAALAYAAKTQEQVDPNSFVTTIDGLVDYALSLIEVAAAWARFDWEFTGWPCRTLEGARAEYAPLSKDHAHDLAIKLGSKGFSCSIEEGGGRKWGAAGYSVKVNW